MGNSLEAVITEFAFSLLNRCIPWRIVASASKLLRHTSAPLFRVEDVPSYEAYLLAGSLPGPMVT